MSFPVRKIMRLPNGKGLLGTAGTRYLTGPFEKSFKAGVYEVDKPDVPESERDNFEALWLTNKGIWLYDETYFAEMVGEFAAIGTGGMVAMSYLLDGLTPEEAVKRACGVDVNSAEPVICEQLETRFAHTKAK